MTVSLPCACYDALTGLKQTRDIPSLKEGSADVSVGAARGLGLAQFFNNSRGVFPQPMLKRANPEELFVAACGASCGDRSARARNLGSGIHIRTFHVIGNFDLVTAA